VRNRYKHPFHNPLQVRKLRSDYGLVKPGLHLYLSASDADKAAVLEQSKLQVRDGHGTRMTVPVLLIICLLCAALCLHACGILASPPRGGVGP
jgi:hypothetical protein